MSSFHTSTKNHGHMIDHMMQWDRQFLVVWATLCPFTLNNAKHAKAPGDIILLHMCTKNEDHMIYGS